MTTRHTFPEAMFQISLAAIACMLFNVPDQAKEGIPVGMYILLFAFALISYLGERLFLRIPKSFTVAAVFNLLLVIAGFAAGIALHLVTGLATGVFLGIVLLILAGMAFRETTKGININQLTLCFDALAALLLFYILFMELGSGKPAAALPGAIGVVAAFSGIMVLREGNRISGKDRMYSTLIILGIVAVAFVVYLLAGDPLREGVTGVFAGIGAALAWLGHLLADILRFFSRLFPDPEYENIDLDMGGGISIPEGERGEEIPMSLIPFLVLGGLLVIAVIIVVIVVGRKRKFSGKTVSSAVKSVREQRNRVSLWKALRIWAEDKLYRIKVRIFFLKNRSTPAGRFYRLVRSLKRSGHALQQGETPREFLARYIASLQPDDKRIPGLMSLIEELNLQLYRPS